MLGPLLGLAGQIGHRKAGRGQSDHVPVFQKDHPVGVGQKGGHVRGQIIFPLLAQAQDQGRVLAGPHQKIGPGVVQDDQGK